MKHQISPPEEDKALTFSESFIPYLGTKTSPPFLHKVYAQYKEKRIEFREKPVFKASKDNNTDDH